jgi:RISC-loading complex subunit TARBP2
MLTSLGQEQKFDVKFDDIEEKTLDGEAQCLVQLSTLPVAVCYGVGLDQV